MWPLFFWQPAIVTPVKQPLRRTLVQKQVNGLYSIDYGHTSAQVCDARMPL